ncbi:MAG: hypothetical protein CL843_13575 [Crocinitomicaceae bacterium]|nr:hypothetical protein [Crocinitomicaceae bacterium]|tara:strand:+ start:397 stop:1164 length:768 start_codon:yes stop_codon:yes gene_type:complete
MITVISPAKSLDYKTEVPFSTSSEPLFPERSNEIIHKLQKLSRKGIRELMSLSEKLAELNYDRYQSWQEQPDEEAVRQAIFAFNGDVYAGLDAYTLKESQLETAQKSLRILSGLYGLLRPLDAIQPYRLEMGTKLAIKRKKNLYEYWGDELTIAINQELEKHEEKVLVNLASNEYFSAVNVDKLKAPVITPTFKDEKNGKYKIISFYAKKARGTMVRFMLDENIDKAENLKAFDRDGYVYNEAMSQGNEWVFTRG